MPSHPPRFLIGSLLVLLSLSGCARDSLPYKAHYMFIHRDGYALDEQFHAESTEALKTHLDTTVLKGIQQHVDGLKNPAAASRTGPAGQVGCDGVLRLMIFVHGGMNTRTASIERMEKMLVENDKLPATCYYPVFINWQSGLLSSTVDDLFRLRFGHPSWSFGIASSPFVIAGRMIGSLANLPMSFAHNMDTVVEAGKGADEQGDPLYCTIGDGLLYFPLQAFYVATIPLVEGFGKPAWEIMKRRAQLTVSTRLTDDPEVGDVFVEKFHQRVSEKQRLAKADQSAHPNEGAIRTLVWKLRERIKYHKETKTWYWIDPAGSTSAVRSSGVMPPKTIQTIDRNRAIPVEITLVGHSMGPIILNRLLSVLDIEEELVPEEKPLPVKQIIYMAPAASVNELEYFLVPYLYYNKEARFSMFVLNRRDETREIPIGGSVFFLPRGSLLAWIDTFLEPEASIGQSTSGRMRNLREYYSLEDSPHRRGTTDCFHSDWEAGNGPASEDRELWRQYTHIKLKDQAPKLTKDLGDRFRVYESPARVSDKTVPKEHGDFTEPHYFLEVLCHADEKAFRDWKTTCNQKPYWPDGPPWYTPWASDESYKEFSPVFDRVELSGR